MPQPFGLLIVHAHSLYICLLVCLRKFKFYYHKFLVADMMQFCFQVLICIFKKAKHQQGATLLWLYSFCFAADLFRLFIENDVN